VSLVTLEVNLPKGAARSAVVSVVCVQGQTAVIPTVLDAAGGTAFGGWDGVEHLVVDTSTELELRVPEFATCTLQEVVAAGATPLVIDVDGAPVGCVLLPGARGVQVKAGEAAVALSLDWAA
jgi:hypothetical protein